MKEPHFHQQGQSVGIQFQADTINFVGVDKKPPHLLMAEEPFVAQDFIGRQSELTSIYNKLFVEKSSNILSVVNGDGGIGKTSLVSQYYHKYKDNYAHVAWVLNESSIVDSLLLLARNLNVCFEETDDQTRRMQKLSTKFSELERPSLLVIDNVNDLEDLQKHFILLNQCSNYFHILITSRITKFEKMDFFPIEGLPEPQAIELFKSYYSGVTSDEEKLLKTIISDVGRNTLVIELFAKNMHILNELDPKYSLKNLKEDIEKSLIKLSQSETVSTIYKANGNGLRYASPESIILAMYDVKELDESEKQLISIFAVLPNEKITYANIKRLFPNVEEKPLKSLSQKGWVEFDSDEKSFKVNQVVQDVVKAKHQDRLLEDVDPVMSSLQQEFQSNDLLHKDKYKISMQMVLYAESIVKSIDYLSEKIADLCLRLGYIHSTMGNLEVALKYFEHSAQSRKELHETYPQDVSYKNGLAVSYSQLGDIHSKMGNLELALKYFEDSAQLEK
ncbi:MAG: NB-ARC domain-containing protein, partial [Proteobacteria bacterium]|nr:NB-ARC domain-containing protein [Pseudomonadota bacterium]